MRLARRLRRLLKRRGFRLTDAVKQSLRDFVATVSEENPDYVDPSAEVDEDDVTSAPEPAQQHPITCPHCGETIDIAVDLSGADQDEVQDCSVCCSPIHVTYSARAGQLQNFTSEPY